MIDKTTPKCKIRTNYFRRIANILTHFPLPLVLKTSLSNITLVVLKLTILLNVPKTRQLIIIIVFYNTIPPIKTPRTPTTVLTLIHTLIPHTTKLLPRQVNNKLRLQLQKDKLLLRIFFTKQQLNMITPTSTPLLKLT